jgi:hypothetical protein
VVLGVELEMIIGATEAASEIVCKIWQ